MPCSGIASSDTSAATAIASIPTWQDRPGGSAGFPTKTAMIFYRNKTLYCKKR
jgi:hypothetical protein